MNWRFTTFCLLTSYVSAVTSTHGYTFKSVVIVLISIGLTFAFGRVLKDEDKE